MKPEFVELVLTCGSWQEAQKIADRLLEQKLIASIEFMDIKTRAWWDDEVEAAKEVKLILTTASHLFKDIEEEVRNLHSNEQFVLAEIPISNISAGVQEWLKNNTK
jgi:uncharacterized protein involved in tolerance to divalent cations